MECSTIESKYQSLLPSIKDLTKPELSFILLIHSINLSTGLKCTGLSEDDPEKETDLPTNWDKPIEGVYSLRYKDPKTKDTLYLKIVVEGPLISVNGITASRNNTIYSLDFIMTDYPQMDPENIRRIYKQYRNELLAKISKSAKEESKSTQTNAQDRTEDDGFFGDSRYKPSYIIDKDGQNDLFPGQADPFGFNPRGGIFFPLHHRPGVYPSIQWDPLGPDGIDPTTPDPDIEIPPNMLPRGGDPRKPFGEPGRYV